MVNTAGSSKVMAQLARLTHKAGLDDLSSYVILNDGHILGVSATFDTFHLRCNVRPTTPK